MLDLLRLLLNTILPVFLLASLGWFARRHMKIGVADPATITIYLLSPGLVAHSILTTQMGAGEVGKILAFGIMLTLAMIAITTVTGWAMGWQFSQRNAAILSTAFMNCANYGLPVVLLSFGQPGFERATIFVVLESILMNTVAVYFAAWGRMKWSDALRSVFRMPVFWSALVSIGIRLTAMPLPDAILKPLSMLSNGAVVLALILLGMQVSTIKLKGSGQMILLITLMRLVVSPSVAVGLVAILRPEPLTAKVLVLQSAMPAAVSTMLLALKFDAEPNQVSGVSLVSTLASLASLSFWVWLLQSRVG